MDTRFAAAVGWLREDDGEAAYEAAGSWGRDLAPVLADLLEQLGELAPYWNEPYAAPFVPIIEAGLRLAKKCSY